jgi:gamma-glutamyltranspeptidase/glutathione hydrolase
MRKLIVASCLFLTTLTTLTACKTPALPPAPGESVVVGAIASASPEATEAGRRILAAGGNAIDAAIAVSLALAVTEPAMSGLGGQTQMLLFSPLTDGVVINGTSWSPSETPAAASKADLTGRRATTVPTTLKVLDYAYRKYASGNLTWNELIEPAIGYAENGFELGPFRQKVLARHSEQLRKDEATGALFATLEEGEPFRQPTLAATLRRIAAEGAVGFYQGDMARQIADDMEAHGGWIRYEDLAGLADPLELAPLRTTYRGYDVLSLPPPGGGWLVARMLEMLETFDPAALAPNSVERPDALARVLHVGHRERYRDPITELSDYDEEIRNRFAEGESERLLNEEGGETTHFSIVDGDGMAVSVTASINAYFGARVAHPALGFLYNDYMNEFEVDRPEHPFALAANAMPYSSMSPTILARDGRARLVLGSPGSARIISAVTQVAQLWVDSGLGLAESVSYPRWHVDANGELFVENPERDQQAIERLRARGLSLREPAIDLANEHGNPFFGGVHAVANDNGEWVAAADPRRDGSAVVVLRERPR